MNIGDILKELAKNNFNFKGFADGVIDGILEPALDNLVASTENTFDDMAKAALYPLLEAELKKLIHKGIDDLLD